MTYQELDNALSFLETGMELFITDTWVATTIGGSPLDQSVAVMALAPKFMLNCKKETGGYRYSKP